MTQIYQKPSVYPIGFEFGVVQLGQSESSISLSPLDILGIVQSAFDELEPQSPEFNAIKLQVLTEVADGKLALALKTAIVGAGVITQYKASARD